VDDCIKFRFIVRIISFSVLKSLKSHKGGKLAWYANTVENKKQGMRLAFIIAISLVGGVRLLPPLRRVWCNTCFCYELLCDSSMTAEDTSSWETSSMLSWFSFAPASKEHITLPLVRYTQDIFRFKVLTDTGNKLFKRFGLVVCMGYDNTTFFDTVSANTRLQAGNYHVCFRRRPGRFIQTNWVLC